MRVSVCCLLVSFSDLIGLTSCNWHDPPTSALLRWFSQQPSSGGGGLDVVIGIRQFAEGRGPKNEGHHLGHRLSPGGCRMMGKAPVTWQWIPTPSFIILQYLDYRMIVDIVCWCVFDCLNCDHMWIYVVILQRWGPNLAKLWSHSNALHLTFAASAWAARKCDVNLRERLSAMHLPPNQNAEQQGFGDFSHSAPGYPEENNLMKILRRIPVWNNHHLAEMAYVRKAHHLKISMFSGLFQVAHRRN